MKNILSAGFFTLLLLLGSASCSKFVDGYEVSPNSPQETTPALLTTVIQVAYLFAFHRTACPARDDHDATMCRYPGSV